MKQIINTASVRSVLTSKGWDQKRLSKELGVSSQAITNWLKGVDFPRPDKLLKLSITLSLPFSDLVHTPNIELPVVAFRKRAGTKTTQDHIERAQLTGALLRPLVPYLYPLNSLRTKINSPSLEYLDLQKAVASVREKLGIKIGSIVSYNQLIKEFSNNDAVIVPVMWGIKSKHENALHILLKSEKITFVFLNLDTYIEDFKFWMAHELAHVFTPELAGTNEGEDYADAFAGALLFPRELAEQAYLKAVTKPTSSAQIKVLQEYAHEHQISLHSIFLQVGSYAKALNLAALKIDSKSIHATRCMSRGKLVNQILFNPTPPEPKTYMATANKIFQSSFFDALKKMIVEKGTGSGYLQQILDISIGDATALHQELIGK